MCANYFVLNLFYGRARKSDKAHGPTKVQTTNGPNVGPMWAQTVWAGSVVGASSVAVQVLQTLKRVTTRPLGPHWAHIGPIGFPSAIVCSVAEHTDFYGVACSTMSEIECPQLNMLRNTRHPSREQLFETKPHV